MRVPFYFFSLVLVFFIRPALYGQAGEIPILAWYSIPAEETSPARFQELKETGINHSFTFYPDAAAVQKALDAAQKAGVKLIISCPELQSAPEATVKRFMNHPALAGYYLRDEPSAGDFPALGDWARQIQAVDAEHFCYLNLLPTYASLEQLQADSYRDYVQRYIEEVPTQVLSFDHYAVLKDSSGYHLREDYYQNLEVFSQEAQKAGRPFWAFALAVAHGPYPIPDMAQLRLQQFSNLAYGAQGLQYFTYWTPGKNPNWNFHHGPIALDGKRTDVYDKISALNREIKALTPVFLGAEVLRAGHVGERIPPHTTRFTTWPAEVKRLQLTDPAHPRSGALVSELRNGAHRYLVLVNRDYRESLSLELSFAQGVKRVLKDGSLVPAALYTERQIIGPGNLLIYQLE